MGRRKWIGRRVVGFYTDRKGRKRPITRGYGPIRYSSHRPKTVVAILPRIAAQKGAKSTTKAVNIVLSSLSMMFPQFSPIFEAGRLILNNRKFFVPFVKILLSRKSSREKIEQIERDLKTRIKRKAISEFSKASSKSISQLLEEQVGFNSIVKRIDKISGETDANVIQNFFENTLEKLIRESTLKVLGSAVGRGKH